MTCTRLFNNSNITRRINYKEDFEVTIQLMQGDYPMDFPEHDFTVTFKSFQGNYEVGRKDGVYNRCAVKDGRLHCYLNSHGLSVGTLRAEIDIKYPDDNFEDGNKRKLLIIGGQVELVSGNTVYTSADIEVPMEVILVDAYQLAVRKGYAGTIEEFYSTFTLLSETMRELREAGKQVADVVSSENSRIEAETSREESERQRVQAEEQRVSNETERISAEVNRTQSEEAREVSEGQRRSAETRRQDNEASRIAAEHERQDNDAKLQREVQAVIEHAVNVASQAANTIDTANAELSDINLKKNEITRVINEGNTFISRMQATETDIESNEQQRVTAENGRETAEQQRVADTQNAIDRVNEAIANVKDGRDGRLAMVHHGTSDNVFALTPNVLHVWGEVASLDLSLNTDLEEDGFLTEYAFQFTCPIDAPTSLALPSDIKWYNGFIVVPQAGKTYQVSIVNNIIIMGGV